MHIPSVTHLDFSYSLGDSHIRFDFQPSGFRIKIPGIQQHSTYVLNRQKTNKFLKKKQNTQRVQSKKTKTGMAFGIKSHFKGHIHLSLSLFYRLLLNPLCYELPFLIVKILLKKQQHSNAINTFTENLCVFVIFFMFLYLLKVVERTDKR
jgi:hypothetical protein